jgi:Ankyrin repeats (3 copies)
MRLTPKQIAWLQEAYAGLGNFEDGLLVDGDPLAPLNPVTWKSPEGDRLIHVAARRGDLAAVELLINAGENVNSIGDMGQTPAHLAATGQHRSVFDLLINRGADTTIVDEFGNSPVQTWASTENRTRWAVTGKRKRLR